MTEEEAKTKWCPQIRWATADHNKGIFNNRGGACICIASDCMMWVWDRNLPPIDRIHQDDKKSVKVTEPLPPTGGHCGLTK